MKQKIFTIFIKLSRLGGSIFNLEARFLDQNMVLPILTHKAIQNIEI